MKFTEYLTLQEATDKPIKDITFDKKDIPTVVRNANKDLKIKLPKVKPIHDKTFKKLDVPAYGRNDGRDMKGSRPSLDLDKGVGKDKAGLEVPAYKRTSKDSGKSIEDAGRAGRFPPRPKPDPNVRTKYEWAREEERRKIEYAWPHEDLSPPSPIGGQVTSFEKEVLQPFKNRQKKK